MPNLTKIRENKLKREKELKFNNENYTIPSSLKIVSNVIKLNNILVMKWLAENKGLSIDQYQTMLDKFLKVNYYCPEKVSKEKFNKKYDL